MQFFMNYFYNLIVFFKHYAYLCDDILQEFIY